MGLKLFLKEHFSFILFQLIVVFFLLSIFWLEGFRNLDTAIYAIAISLLLIGSFLTVRYMLRRRFLGKIIHLPTSMDDALTKSAKTSEHDVVEDYFHEFYRIYQHEVQGLYVKQSRQYKFMNQWIHQMKTPISVLELLMQEDSLDKKSVQEELDRLKRGLDMVLMNARLDNFESDMQIEQVNIRACMTAIINENKRLFITNRVFPTIEIDEELTVASDAKWLHFMLGQFITNAVKYTFEPNKKIFISAEAHQNTTILKIRDEGIGIPKSDLSRVKKAFFTGENGRKTGESTGMGLYLANEISEKLGHTLEIDSKVGVGTEITITF